uniref:DUF2492 family protein n=1 Tax=Thaumasiovibrio occultus TaxID=1891184 RepID=UPI000B35DF53|nr:DUF2492 family protein [Thaumasiovibrio occultus]
MSQHLSVNAQDVLCLLRESDIPYTLNDLSTEVIHHYGRNVVFHSCLQKEMTLQELLDQWVATGLVVMENEFITAIVERCHNA